MTAAAQGSLHQLALKVLAKHAGPAAGAQAVAAATLRAYDDLARVSAPLIGEAGVDALTGRALHLARRDYPCLADTRKPERGDKPFAQVIGCLEREGPAVATAAAGAVLATFAGLLVTFIGKPLTVSLLRKAWSDVYSDASTEEHEA